MRESLARVFALHEPLAYAAGHEHNLQVIKGPRTPYLLVSGAGSFRHVTRVRHTDATLYARQASGFMRIDVGRDGRARLGVVTVSGPGKFREAFARLLE